MSIDSGSYQLVSQSEWAMSVDADTNSSLVDPKQLQAPVPDRSFSLSDSFHLLRLFRYLFYVLATVAIVISLGTLLHSSLSAASSASTRRSRYQYCLSTFHNRSHPDNDGVSIRIAPHSMWQHQWMRDVWRQSFRQWFPPAINIDDVCTRYAEGNYTSVQQVKPELLRHVHPAANICSSASPPALSFDWWSIYDNIEHVFVLGVLPMTDPQFNPSLAEMKSEAAQHGDMILFTDMTENGEYGKTIKAQRQHAADNAAKVSRAASSGYSTTGDYEWDFIMKADDDGFLHLPNLMTEMRSLRLQRLEEVWWGWYFHYPHGVPAPSSPRDTIYYHSGVGNVLSKDLSDWFNSEESYAILNWTAVLQSAPNGGCQQVPLPNPFGIGHEDLIMGQWLAARGRELGRDQSPAWQGPGGDVDEAYRLHHALIKNFIHSGARIYQWPDDRRFKWYTNAPQLAPDTIIVHGTKTMEQAHAAVRHFMCQEPHVFDWGQEKWWMTATNTLFAWNKDGTAKESHEWYNDYGQSYRQTKKTGYIPPP